MAKRGAIMGEPIELYEGPLHRRGPRPEHDLRTPAVQNELLEQAREGVWLYWWLAFPCTAFCTRCKVNGGTRAPEHPEGDRENGPPWEKEGTDQATFASHLFVEAAEHQSFPTAENPAPDGRYPAACETRCWRRVLARPDVLIAPLDMFPYGLAMHADGTAAEAARAVMKAARPLAYYRKRTWLVTCVRELLQVAAHCPGRSPGHQHGELAGRPKGSNVGNCRAAGEYAAALIKAVTTAMVEDALARGAKLRGGCAPHPASKSPAAAGSKAGGPTQNLLAWEADERRVGCQGRQPMGAVCDACLGRYCAGCLQASDWRCAECNAWQCAACRTQRPQCEVCEAAAARKGGACSPDPRQAAREYWARCRRAPEPTKEALVKAVSLGTTLLESAGGWKAAADAARAAWEEHRPNRLAGVHDRSLEGSVDPHLLQYLRHRADKGVELDTERAPARRAAPPRRSAAAHQEEAYAKVWGDAREGRALLVRSDAVELDGGL